MTSPPTYLLAGGGSGGHLFPAIAVARELLARRPQARILFVGSEKSVEQQILTRAGFEQHHLPAASSTDLKRNPLAFARNNWRAWRAARQLIRERAPAIVIGCGGYASIAPLLAARRAGIPVVVLEQNVVPGRATAWLSRIAGRVCISFEETRRFLPRRAPGVLTGNPVRAEFAALHGQPREFGEQRTLLILGGSQGAHSLNVIAAEFVERNADVLRDWSVLHQTGAADHAGIADRYESLPIQAAATPFIDDMAAACSRASLVISRAGATTLAELACCGLPALLVPHRHSLRHHQRRNADYFAQRGSALILLQSDSESEDAALLTRTLLPLLSSPALLCEMSAAMRRLARPAAAQSVCDVIDSLTPDP